MRDKLGREANSRLGNMIPSKRTMGYGEERAPEAVTERMGASLPLTDHIAYRTYFIGGQQHTLRETGWTGQAGRL